MQQICERFFLALSTPCLSPALSSHHRFYVFVDFILIHSLVFCVHRPKIASDLFHQCSGIIEILAERKKNSESRARTKTTIEMNIKCYKWISNNDNTTAAKWKTTAISIDWAHIEPARNANNNKLPPMAATKNYENVYISSIMKSSVEFELAHGYVCVFRLCLQWNFYLWTLQTLDRLTERVEKKTASIHILFVCVCVYNNNTESNQPSGLGTYTFAYRRAEGNFQPKYYCYYVSSVGSNYNWTVFSQSNEAKYSFRDGKHIHT